MNIYKITNKGLSEIEKNPFALERDIQGLVEENLDQLFGLQFVATEYSVGEYRLDTLAFDKENSAFVIVEYKKGHSYSVIDQGYSYLSTMLENKAEFILEYNERLGETLKREDIDWSSSRVLFVSPSFNSYQKNSVNFKDVPFELWEIKRFSGDLILLEQHKSSSKESIEKFSNANTDILNVTSEVKVHSESEHLSRVGTELQNTWEELKGKFLELDDTGVRVKRDYVAVTKGKKTVFYTKFQKKALVLEFIRGDESADGVKSKSFFDLKDPEGVAITKDFRWKSGVKHYDYEIRVNSKSDLDYVVYLLKQKYESI